MMSKIKILSVVGIALASTAVYAGGPEVATVPACVVPFTPFAYIGGAVGWAYSDWNSFIFDGANNFFGFSPFVGDIDTNGVVFGGKLGYQATDNFGVEVGGYVLPNSNQELRFFSTNDNDDLLGTDEIHGKVRSWFAYAAGTLRAGLPFQPNTHLFTKVGGVYRSLSHSGDLYDNVRSGSYWTVLFGAGFDVDLQAYQLPILVGLEYLLVPGSSDSWFDPATSTGINKNSAPAAHIAVATFSLKLVI